MRDAVVYAWHHAVTLAVALLAAWSLAGARWPARSPRLAVLLWQSTAFSIVTGAVGLLLSVGLTPYRRGIAAGLGELLHDLGDGAARIAPAHAAAVVAGLLLALAAVSVQAGSSWRVRRHRSRHHLLLRLVARTDAHDHALVIDHPAMAAYYLPGHPDGVVVSTGALDALTEPEVAAVLAHEQAHAREHHHLVLAPFQALRTALPWRPIQQMTSAVELLIEMCADDRAARTCGPDALATALRRFHDLGGQPGPAGTLAVADHAIALRIARLYDTRPPIPPLLTWMAGLTALAVTTTPLILFVLPA